MMGSNIGITDFKTEGASSEIFATSDSSKSFSGSIYILAANFTEKNQPAARAMILTREPHRTTKPRSAPSSPAAATGPGVGGTIVWVA